MKQRISLFTVLVVSLISLVCCETIDPINQVRLLEFEAYFLDELAGDVLCIEHWHYHFEEEQTEVHRSLPAGYSKNRKTNNDGVGNIAVLLGNSTNSIPEVLPSIHNHQPNTVEIFESVSLLSVILFLY